MQSRTQTYREAECQIDRRLHRTAHRLAGLHREGLSSALRVKTNDRLTAAGLVSGCKFTSLRGAFGAVGLVVGSFLGAPEYRKMAELIPFSKPVPAVFLSGAARIQ